MEAILGLFVIFVIIAALSGGGGEAASPTKPTPAKKAEKPYCHYCNGSGWVNETRYDALNKPYNERVICLRCPPAQ